MAEAAHTETERQTDILTHRQTHRQTNRYATTMNKSNAKERTVSWHHMSILGRTCG